MKARQTFQAFWTILCLLVLFEVSAYGQATNHDLAKLVQGFASHGDYDAIEKLINSQETEWNSRPSTAYFENMTAIAGILAGGTTQRIYWMGREVMWKMLLKPVPNEYSASMEFYFWKHQMFFLDAENITAYVDHLRPEAFASIRHDTFLMLSEYVRQLHATIIPGYHEKYSGAMNDAAERKQLIQNAIDNQVQQEARLALSSLVTDHINYLINAYSHEPRDDEELKALLDILNVKSVDRARVMQDTH